MPTVSAEDRPLSPLQVRFVEEYVTDPTSVTKAAKRAGYSLHTANEAGGRLMMDPRIKRSIQIAQDKRSEAIGISKERILQELAKIAFATVGAEIKVTDDGDIDLHSIKNSPSEVTVTSATGGNKKSKITSVKTVKMADKVAALVKLGQHHGMFKEQVEINGKLSLADLINQSFDAPEVEVNNNEIIQENEEELLRLEDKSEITS